MSHATFQKFDGATTIGLLLDILPGEGGMQGDIRLEGAEEALLQFQGKTVEEAALAGINFLYGKLEEADAANTEATSKLCDALSAERDRHTLRPIDDWHEDIGPAIWFRIEDGQVLGEPPYIGNMLDEDWPEHTDGESYYNAWIPLPDFHKLILP